MHLPLCTTAVKENNTQISRGAGSCTRSSPRKGCCSQGRGGSQARWSWHFLYGEAKSLFSLTAVQGRTISVGFDVLIVGGCWVFFLLATQLSWDPLLTRSHLGHKILPWVWEDKSGVPLGWRILVDVTDSWRGKLWKKGNSECPTSSYSALYIHYICI